MANIEKKEVNPLELISTAISNDVDVEKLSKLMDLQERWETRQAQKSFLSALTEFQSICPEIKKTKSVEFKTRDNDIVSYKFAPLGSIIKQIKEPLKICGLSYRWQTKDENNNITITCILSHSDGHSETNTIAAGPDTSGKKNPIQQRASTISYLQRYTLIGVLGVGTSQDDIDGLAPEKTVKNIADDLAKFTKTINSMKDLHELRLFWDDFDPKKRVLKKYKAIATKKLDELKGSQENTNLP